MRIVIDIEDIEHGQPTDQPKVTVTVSPSAPAAPDDARDDLAPPPEVLETAEALGADSAGPAPNLASSPTVPTQTAESSEQMDAGGAPENIAAEG